MCSSDLPDQGANPCLLHWQADSQPLRHQGSPISLILETLPPLDFRDTLLADSPPTSVSLRGQPEGGSGGGDPTRSLNVEVLVSSDLLSLSILMI